MITPTFRSSLAPAISELVNLKRLEGYDYTKQSWALGHFDAFLYKQGYEQTFLSRQTAEAYIEHTAHMAPNSCYSLLSTIRVLSRHLQQSDPRSYVLNELSVRRPSLPRWYLYSQSDISSLFRHARSLWPSGSLQQQWFRLLVGTLLVTGLRIAEALALNIGDVELSRGLILVRKGKLGKARYVALDASTIQVLTDHLNLRAARELPVSSAPLFVTRSGSGCRLKYSEVANAFRRIVRACGIGRGAPQAPRLHDLRHTYACNCLLKWYDEGADVTSKLPILATALGHVNVASTQIYLHVSSRLLEQATTRFRTTFTANCKGE